jgi:hypothetical protein
MEKVKINERFIHGTLRDRRERAEVADGNGMSLISEIKAAWQTVMKCSSSISVAVAL